MEEKSFPLHAEMNWQSGDYTHLKAWESSDFKEKIFRTEFPLLLDLPQYIDVPMDKARRIRQIEDKLELELTFNVLSCSKDEKRGPISEYIGGGRVGDTRVPPIEIEVGSRHEETSVIQGNLLSATLRAGEEILWRWEKQH